MHAWLNTCMLCIARHEQMYEWMWTMYVIKLYVKLVEIQKRYALANEPLFKCNWPSLLHVKHSDLKTFAMRLYLRTQCRTMCKTLKMLLLFVVSYGITNKFPRETLNYKCSRLGERIGGHIEFRPKPTSWSLPRLLVCSHPLCTLQCGNNLLVNCYFGKLSASTLLERSILQLSWK